MNASGVFEILDNVLIKYPFQLVLERLMKKLLLNVIALLVWNCQKA